MKKTHLLLLTVIALAIGFTSCSKDDEDNRKKLEIYVSTQLNQPIENATVKIYRRYQDYLDGTNQIGETQITNKDGIATFFDLPNDEYQCIVEKGCLRNNLNDVTHYYPKLTMLNYLSDVPSRSFVVYETETVNLVNSSGNNSYSFYLNDEYVSYGIIRNSTVPLFLPTGNDYNIKVTPVGNSFKVVKEIDVNLTCGQGETITLP